MDNLKDQISEQIKSAMKAKDKVRLDVLRYVKKLLIDNQTSTKPQPEQDVVIAYAKKVKDSLAMYPEDSDHAKKIKDEIIILNEFLPEPMTEKQVIELINKIKNVIENPNMGSIMKELSGQIRGRFDGKKASQLVQAALKT